MEETIDIAGKARKIAVEFYVLRYIESGEFQIVCYRTDEPISVVDGKEMAVDSGPYQTYREAEAAIPKPPPGWDNQPDHPYAALKGWGGE
jgi:hypothetical protein